MALPLVLSKEDEASVRQDIVSSAHRAFDARGFGVRTLPGFVAECMRKRVWEQERRLEGGGTQGPVSFIDFITRPYPTGIGATLEEIEQVISGDVSLSQSWEELTGRPVPAPGGALRISEVIIPDARKRELNEVRVHSLADSIEELGLLNPISVTPQRVLVAGWHRLEACRSLGWETIPANQINVDDLHRELAEIDENLVRYELSTLDRSEQLQRRMEIYEALHPETRQGTAGGKAGGRGRIASAESATAIPAFADDTAAKTGRSARVIREEVQISEGLDEGTKRIVRGTPLADRKTELLELARETEPEKQREMAQKVVSGEAKSVHEAAGKPATDTLVVRAFRLVERMTPSERLDFDRQIRPLVAAAAGGA